MKIDLLDRKFGRYSIGGFSIAEALVGAVLVAGAATVASKIYVENAAQRQQGQQQFSLEQVVKRAQLLADNSPSCVVSVNNPTAQFGTAIDASVSQLSTSGSMVPYLSADAEVGGLKITAVRLTPLRQVGSLGSGDEKARGLILSRVDVTAEPTQAASVLRGSPPKTASFQVVMKTTPVAQMSGAMGQDEALISGPFQLDGCYDRSAKASQLCGPTQRFEPGMSGAVGSCVDVATVDPLSYANSSLSLYKCPAAEGNCGPMTCDGAKRASQSGESCKQGGVWKQETRTTIPGEICTWRNYGGGYRRGPGGSGNPVESCFRDHGLVTIDRRYAFTPQRCGTVPRTATCRAGVAQIQTCRSIGSSARSAGRTICTPQSAPMTICAGYKGDVSCPRIGVVRMLPMKLPETTPDGRSIPENAALNDMVNLVR